MIYTAKILHLDDDIEEEAVLLIEGISLTCFVNVCPFKIYQDMDYKVDLNLWSLEGLELAEVPENEPSAISRIGTGFAYSLIGRLNEGKIEVGALCFEDPDSDFLTEFSYLEGKNVRVIADRITAEFLEALEVSRPQ